MPAMARRALCLLILGVLVACPLAANAAGDFWADGMYDPELDAVRHTPISLDAATDRVLTLGLADLPVIRARVQPANDDVAPTHTPSPRRPRAPPFS